MAPTSKSPVCGAASYGIARGLRRSLSCGGIAGGRSSSSSGVGRKQRRPTHSCGNTETAGWSASSGDSRQAVVGDKADVGQAPLVAYLRLFGLSQYASKFAEAGLGDFSAIARLTESQEVDFLESIQVYPGQRVKLVRAIESLRHAVSLGSLRKETKDSAIMDRLCERNEALSLERSEAQAQCHIQQEENHHLFIKIREQEAANREQAARLQQAQERTAELEQAVWTQNEQVSFLALQLQKVMEKGSAKVEQPAQQSHVKQQPLQTAGGGDCEGFVICEDAVRRLSALLHRRLEKQDTLLRPRRANQDGSPGDAYCIFLDRASSSKAQKSTKMLSDDLPSPTLQHSDSGSEHDALSPGSPFADGQAVPSKWEISQVVAETMERFQMQPEASIVALVYLDRFSEKSGEVVSADNWRRLIFTSLILASKVWDEVPFNNNEIAQISPTYSLEELQTFERIFVQALEFDLSVHDTEYGKVQQRLLNLESKPLALGAPLPTTLSRDRAAILNQRCAEEQA